MKKKFYITRRRGLKLLCVTTFLTILFSACQNDILIPDQRHDLEEVLFKFSFDDAIQTGTDYQPMTRSACDAIEQLNGFGYIITEKLSDGKYIVADIGTSSFNSEESAQNLITIGEVEAREWSVTLRPGTYSISLYTCVEATEWNMTIKVGDIIDPTNPTWAMKYTTADDLSTLKETEDCLLCEIYCGTQNFTVTKTKDLHTVNTLDFTLSLKRKVAKFRSLFSTEPTPFGKEFKNFGVGGVIDQARFAVGYTELTDVSGKGLPDGLDVFGKAYYDTSQKRNSLFMVQAHWKELTYTSYPHTFYMSCNHDWQYCPYIFTDDDNPLKVKVTHFEFGAGKAGSLKRSRYTGNSSPIFTIESNKVYGCMMRLTDATYIEDGNTIHELEPVLDSGNWIDPALWLDTNFEFN